MAKGEKGKRILEATKVCKEYVDGERRLQVLSGVDLHVDGGEFVSIIGESGSGKSTLLHILGGLDIPSEGQVTLGEHRLHEMTDRQLATLRNIQVGFVYQFHHLLPEFTALENVMLPGMIGANPPGSVVAKAEGLLRQMGLGERLDHRPSKLSGGEQQRVAIARALQNDPMLVLADEPTGNLDQKTSGEVLEFLIKVTKESGKSLVMVTHDPAIAARADRCLRLKGGRLVSSP